MFLSRQRAANQVRTKTAALLITNGALIELSGQDAGIVVDYMTPHLIKAGAVVVQEGQVQGSDFMALVVSGEVTVESAITTEGDGMVVSVLGPGSLIGELCIVGGGARSATCIASTDLSLAVLTRDALTRLTQAKPAVAARLLMAISKRIADDLRETNRKLITFAQLSKALQQELDAAHGVNRRLLERMSAIVSQAGQAPVTGHPPVAALPPSDFPPTAAPPVL